MALEIVGVFEMKKKLWLLIYLLLFLVVSILPIVVSYEVTIRKLVGKNCAASEINSMFFDERGQFHWPMQIRCSKMAISGLIKQKSVIKIRYMMLAHKIIGIDVLFPYSMQNDRHANADTLFCVLTYPFDMAFLNPCISFVVLSSQQRSNEQNRQAGRRESV